jgi:hypothetical protein
VPVGTKGRTEPMLLDRDGIRATTPTSAHRSPPSKKNDLLTTRVSQRAGPR